MQEDLNVRIQEGDTNVIIDLQQDPAPFPEPSIFNWSKDGQSLSSNDNNIISIAYSMVTFLLVTRNTSGNYTVSATNFLLDNPSQELGRDIGGFYLNVLCKYYGYRVILLCGVNCIHVYYSKFKFVELYLYQKLTLK